jgi:hypothetical protein
MVTKFHNLKSVNLAGCSEVTDIGVQALAEQSSGLKTVNLMCCSEVLVERLLGLKSVNCGAAPR